MNTCGICQQTAEVTEVQLDDMTVDVCALCIALGPVDCARNVLLQAETAVFLGRVLLQLPNWPQATQG